MQYTYIVGSNSYPIDRDYMNIMIIIVGDLYQLNICRSRFCHKNTHFNTLSQHKMHLMYENTFFVQKFETRITYK